MFLGRYALAIAAGLAIGIAVGWLTNQPSDQPAPHRQATHHRSGPERVDATPDQQPPPTTPKPPAEQPPGMQQIQRMLAHCLAKPTTLGQLTCLERVLTLVWQYDVQPPLYDDPFSGSLDSSTYYS